MSAVIWLNKNQKKKIEKFYQQRVIITDYTKKNFNYIEMHDTANKQHIIKRKSTAR